MAPMNAWIYGQLKLLAGIAMAIVAIPDFTPMDLLPCLPCTDNRV